MPAQRQAADRRPESGRCFNGNHLPRMADDSQGHRDTTHTAILHRLAVALSGIHLYGKLLPAMRTLHL